ncbi:collagen-like protein, partial [bacterium]|nr:collagen-like protein [bacterium]
MRIWRNSILSILFLFLTNVNLVQSAELQLVRGWNFVSIPILQKIPIESFLEIHSIELKSIWLWNQDLKEGAGGWAVYPRYAGFESLKEFEPRRGYWLQSSVDLSIEAENIIDDSKDYAFALQAGAHSIGFGSANIPIEPERFFAGENTPRVLWGWNPSERQWEFCSKEANDREKLLERGFKEFQLMEPGRGYYATSKGMSYPKVPFLRGPRGHGGPKGERGERGPAGPPGEKGEPGDLLVSAALVEDLRATTLSLRGLMRLSKYHEEPAPCNDAYESVLALNLLNNLCLCNGSKWVYINSAHECVWDFSVPEGQNTTGSDASDSSGVMGLRGTVVVELLDRVSGDRINGATVTVGSSSTSDSSNGTYSLDVTMKIPADQIQTARETLPLSINAEGYSIDGEVPNEISVLAGQSIKYSITIAPVLGRLEGRIAFEKYDQLYD